MATDYFIGFSQADKLALLLGLQKSILTGSVVEVSTARGVTTKFSPSNSELNYQRLTDSIANSPDFDPTDAVQVACRANRRRGTMTRVDFGGGRPGGWRG